MNFRNAAIAAAAVLILAVVGFVLVQRRGGDLSLPLPKKSPERPASQAQFQAVEVRAADAGQRPQAQARANEQANKVVLLMNDYYTKAFLRPEVWEPGAAPAAALSPFFTAETATSLGVDATSNIGALGLANIGPRLVRVDPSRAEIQKISFDVESDLSMPVAIVTVAFQASGTTKEKSDGPVDISHTATYWLWLEGENYKIFGYAVELKAATVTKSAAFRIPAELNEEAS